MSPAPRKKRRKKEPKGLRILLYSIIIALGLVMILVILPREPAKNGPKKPESTPVIYADVPEETVQPALTPARENRSPDLTSAPTQKRARLAMVFDDTGYSLGDLEPLLALPYKLTVAVLPGLTNSRKASIKAHEAGKEVILHQPMESLGGENMGPGGITTTMAAWKMQAVLSENLDSIEFEKGVNNHMGSRATADMIVMDAVMEVLASRRLFFLDSRTTAETVAEESARRFQVPFLRRSVFWDNQTDRAYLRNQWLKAVDLCEKQGEAVLIGHTQNADRISAVIKENYPDESSWLALVYLSDL